MSMHLDPLDLVLYLVAVFAIGYVVVGMVVFWRQRPVLVPMKLGRWLFAVIYVIPTVYSFWAEGMPESGVWSVTVSIGVLLFLFLRFPSGYTIFGIDDERFSMTLRRMSDQSGTEIKECIGGFLVNDARLRFQVRFMSMIGSASIDRGGKASAHDLKALMVGFRQVFSASSDLFSRRSAFRLIGFGILGAAWSGYIIFYR